jgi:serine/threonine protein kinase
MNPSKGYGRDRRGSRNTVLRTGQRIGPYELEEQAGASRMGVLYRARDTRLRRPVALRIVASDLAADPVTRARLNRESTALAALDHPNVPPLYEAEEIDGRIVIASRWVDGTSLSELVQREGPLDPVRAVRIVNQAANALQAAHGLGIMHRNVKPSTILVTAADHVYLTDFGLARHHADMTGLTQEEDLLDSYDYVAPEYLDGREADSRVDVYGLGCSLYESLTGEVPFPRPGPAAKMYAHLSAEPPSARAHRPEVPARLDAVIRRAMAKDPAGRQQSPEEFAVDAASAVGWPVPPWVGQATRATAPSEGGAKASPVADGAQADAGAGRGPADEPSPATRFGDDGTRPPVQPVGRGHGQRAAPRAPGGDDAHPARDPYGALAGDYYEPVFYRQPWRPPRRWLLWAILVLVFLAAPAALAIALGGH